MRTIKTTLTGEELGFILASITKFFVTANLSTEDIKVAENLIVKLKAEWESGAK